MTASILDKIGSSPLVEIKRLNPYKAVRIFAKMESFNPAGSVKERIALSMIEAGEKSGELTHDKVVLEATSGNTGIGIAMVCAVKGYKCQLVMPESASIERRKIMTAYGAEILLTPAKKSTDGAIEQAYAMARRNPERYFLTDQFNNPANWQAHFNNTGPEIWEQTGGKVTDVVATMGTTGTVMGLSRYFAKAHPTVKVTAMEPFYNHKIQGLKNMKESYCPGIFDKTLPYQIVNIADDEAFETARNLARVEGIFAGMSSGAALACALHRARQLDKGYIVVIFPDGGEKYLSTTLFSKEEVEVKDESKSILRFYNTMSRKKEVFKPIKEGEVTFYACGPTAYEYAHIGHCRRFIFADLINRLLSVKGYKVKYYMNFTDLDDNTINGADKAGQSLDYFTEHYISCFKEDIKRLGVVEATCYPRATEHVDAMIDMTKRLIDKGFAYEKHGSVYFNISKFVNYGRLSRIDLSKIKVGKTVDLDDYEKEHPTDFTLLKRSTLAELKKGIFYESPYGNVRPGWHIECAAMTTHFLGDTMDIHASGANLIFPHHENENAIAEALTGKPLARYWMHNALVLVDGKKMSHEMDNVVTFRDLLEKGYSPRTIRYLLMTSHYRKPLIFSERKLKIAQKNLLRLDEFTRKLVCLPLGLPHGKVASYVSALEDGFFAALDDDLNISKAMAALFEFVKKMNMVLCEGQLDQEQKNYIVETLKRLDQVLNIMRIKECPLAPEIDELLADRERARNAGNWQKADDVRAQLEKEGIEVLDSAQGPVWKEIEKKKRGKKSKLDK